MNNALKFVGKVVSNILQMNIGVIFTLKWF